MQQKKILLLSLLALCHIASAWSQPLRVNRQQLRIEGVAFARVASITEENYLYIDEFTIHPGETKTVPVYLHNTTPIWTFQLDVNTSSGLVVEGAALSSTFASSSVGDQFSFDAGNVGSTYRILAYNMQKTMSVTPSDRFHVIDLTVSASDDATAGGASIDLQNFEFIDASTNRGVIGSDKSCHVQILPLFAESITLSKTNIELLIGSTEQLTAIVTPDNISDKSVTWSSSDPAVATVDTAGLVTAVAVGQATITATTTDGTGLTAGCQVTVLPIVATGIALEPLAVTLTAGETCELALTITPDNTTYKTASWNSSDVAVATVDENGVVTAVAPGHAQITATTIDDTGLSATSVVTVLARKASAISIAPDSVLLDIGSSTCLTATIEPADVGNTVLLWQSSDEEVVIVTSMGMVYAVGAGQALITATTTDGTNLTDTCHVLVHVPFSMSAQIVAMPVNALRRIPIVVDNHVPVKSFDFTIQVPEGIHFDSDAQPAPRCSDFSVATIYNEDSTVVQVEGMMTNLSMAAGTAPFVLLPIKSSKYIDTFELNVTDIVFTSTNDGVGTQQLDDIIVTLRVLDMGDVNGDKVVDVSDVNALINAILGKESLTNFSVGDMNGDGVIDVTDVNAIINLMLGKE